MGTANQELCKQPNEKRKYGMEFGANLDTSEEISSIDSITSETNSGDTSDLTITSSGIIDGDATNSKVSFWVEGGTSGTRYRIEVVVTTNAGQILEGDGLLKVSDR